MAKKVIKTAKAKKKKRKLTLKGYIVFGMAGIGLFVLAMYVAYKIVLASSGLDKELEQYSIIGVDVSKHTGRINWEKMKGHGIDFAYIKSTEGATYLDPRFEYNFREAKKVGLPVGAYHFFRFHRSGEAQAENFKSHVKFSELDLPPVVDVEEWGQYNNSKNADTVSEEIRAFIENVEAVSKRKVVIYSDKNSYWKYIDGKFDDNEVWICSLGDVPQIGRKWTFWQRSHTGRFRGARGKVDVNTFNGDREKWEEYLAN